MSSIVDTIRATLAALRAKAMATADLPPHKIGEGEVDPVLQPLEKELTIALDQLKAFKNDDKAKHLHAKDLREAREILGHCDSLYHEGVFHVEGVAADAIPAGQAKLASMLAEGHQLLRECLDRVDAYHVGEPLRGLSTKLDNILHALEGLKEKTDLHPGDLLHLRRKLAEVDAHYHEGRFDKEGAGEKVPEGQAVLASNLATAHETVRALLMKTDYYKVSEPLSTLTLILTLADKDRFIRSTKRCFPFTTAWRTSRCGWRGCWARATSRRRTWCRCATACSVATRSGRKARSRLRGGCRRGRPPCPSSFMKLTT